MTISAYRVGECHTILGRRGWLERAIFNGLVFPMCWEDPEVDAMALQIEPSDMAIMITSAGCNPLNLLLEGPRKLVCVDANPAQNALLELKLAAIESLDWSTFRDIFSGANPSRIRCVYQDTLRPRLSRRAVLFWDRRLGLIEKGLYRSGKMGTFFRFVRAYLRTLGLTPSTLSAFFASTSLAVQRDFYHRYFAPALRAYSSAMLARAKPLLYLSGMHPRQLKVLTNDGDSYACARARIQHALVDLPAQSNYFWHMALVGRFRDDCVPPYLLERNFAVLRERSSRILIVYGWLDAYLRSLDAGSVDAINLRDSLDWMPPEERLSLWQSVERVGHARTRVLLRSASTGATVQGDAPAFEEDIDLSGKLTFADRSATHGRVILARRRHATVRADGSARANIPMEAT